MKDIHIMSKFINVTKLYYKYDEIKLVKSLNTTKVYVFQNTFCIIMNVCITDKMPDVFLVLFYTFPIYNSIY